MITNVCIACGGLELETVATIEGYIAGDSYEIVSCKACNSAFSLPHRSDDRVYDLIYKHRKTAPGYARYAQYAEEIISKSSPLSFLSKSEEMYHAVSKEVMSNVPKGGRILDVGCGLGYMTYALSKAGYKATGIDISEEAIKNATETYGDYFIAGDFFKHDPSEKYDAICMLELIEHVENPHTYIAQAKSLLKREGVLIITTPNRSWFPTSDIWNTDLPPVHITWFSEKGITALLSSHNLKAKFFDFTMFNLLYGTLSKPLPTSSVRTPVFSKEGNMLTVPYYKSTLRIKAERWHVYPLLKGALNAKRKIGDLFTSLRNPSVASLKRSGTICVSAYNKE